MFRAIVTLYKKLLSWADAISFVGPLALRLYLVPIFWMAGTEKLLNIESTAQWFGNPDWGLGLPYPELLAYLASITEVVGAVCLLVGFATRLISIPLIITMVVAIFTVHIENGWLAIAGSNTEATARLQDLMTWLETAEPMRHQFVSELGTPVMLNNGIEFAVTYLIMLVSLIFTGPGRYLSVDYWVKRVSLKHAKSHPLH